LGGLARFTGVKRPTTSSKKEVAIAPFAVGEQREVGRLGNHLTNVANGLGEQFLVSLTTLERPEKTAGAFHDDNRPAFGFSRWSVMMDFGVQFVPFQNLLEKLMTQTIQKQHLFDTRQTPFPCLDTVFRHMEGAASSVDTQSFMNGRQDLLNTAQRRP
jgi:hypothetical protein